MHIDGRSPGEPPYTLLDYFPDDFLLVIDESHVAVPQLHGQYEGDRSRKDTLVEHGFRLPSAADNRPLRFEEFIERVNQVVFLSATPGRYELRMSTPGGRADRAAHRPGRPRGRSSSPPRARSTTSWSRSRSRVTKGDRVLVTTLTKKMAEDLTDYLLELGVRVRYLHSEVDTIQRIEILRDLRLGEFDVLVGINLLREGLDLPEVSLVAILDADKEGFLRSADVADPDHGPGRPQRRRPGRSCTPTASPTRCSGPSARPTAAAALQEAYNAEHGIDPQTIRKAVTDILVAAAARRRARRCPGKDRRSREPRPAAGRSELAELPQRRAGPPHPDARGGDARGRRPTCASSTPPACATRSRT